MLRHVVLLYAVWVRVGVRFHCEIIPALGWGVWAGGVWAFCGRGAWDRLGVTWLWEYCQPWLKGYLRCAMRFASCLGRGSTTRRFQIVIACRCHARVLLLVTRDASSL